MEDSLVADLRDMDAKGYLSYLRSSTSLLDVFEEGARLGRGMLAAGSDADVEQWRAARESFFALCDQFLGGDAETRIISDADRQLQSGALSEEEKSLVRAERDRVPAAFADARQVHAMLQQVRASLRDSLAGSFCIVSLPRDGGGDRISFHAVWLSLQRRAGLRRPGVHGAVGSFPSGSPRARRASPGRCPLPGSLSGRAAPEAPAVAGRRDRRGRRRGCRCGRGLFRRRVVRASLGSRGEHAGDGNIPGLAEARLETGGIPRRCGRRSPAGSRRRASWRSTHPGRVLPPRAVGARPRFCPWA